MPSSRPAVFAYQDEVPVGKLATSNKSFSHKGSTCSRDPAGALQKMQRRPVTLFSPTGLFFKDVAQRVSEVAHSALHVLQLGDQPHRVLARQSLCPRLQHGNRAAHSLQLMKAIHGVEHTFDQDLVQAEEPVMSTRC